MNKTCKVISLGLLALALTAAPALAQRGGGGRSGSSSSPSRSSSSSVSRSSSPSRSSSSMSRSSSPSRSSSSVSRSSSPSRSSSSVNRSSSSASPSRSVGSVNRSSSSASPSRSVGSVNRSSSSASPSRPVGSVNRSSNGPARSTAGINRSDQSATRAAHPAPGGSISSRPLVRDQHAAPAASGAAHHVGGGHPLPPAERPIHHAPYFHHPWAGHMVYCHPIFWDPIPPRAWYWPGFWHYCNSYWYDYHVTDVVVVHDYVEKTYKVDLVTYGISGDIMYAIVRDHGDTYLQVYDNEDHLLAEQKINKRYCNMSIDAENGGCWISKKNNKDALLFIWTGEKLLIYEAD